MHQTLEPEPVGDGAVTVEEPELVPYPAPKFHCLACKRLELAMDDVLVIGQSMIAGTLHTPGPRPWDVADHVPAICNACVEARRAA